MIDFRTQLTAELNHRRTQMKDNLGRDLPFRWACGNYFASLTAAIERLGPVLASEASHIYPRGEK